MNPVTRNEVPLVAQKKLPTPSAPYMPPPENLYAYPSVAVTHQVKPEVRSMVLTEAHGVAKVVLRQRGHKAKERCTLACPLEPVQPRQPTSYFMPEWSSSSDTSETSDTSSQKDKDDDEDNSKIFAAIGTVALVGVGVVAACASQRSADAEELVPYQKYFKRSDDELESDPKLQALYRKAQVLLEDVEKDSSDRGRLQCCCITSGLCCVAGACFESWPLIAASSLFSLSSCGALTVKAGRRCCGKDTISDKAQAVLKDVHVKYKQD